MDDFTWASFGIGILETAIGAALGFGLGLVAFHYQHKREKDTEANEAREAALSALNRVTQTAGLNIEALANLKLQIIEDIKPEVATMKEAVEAWYDADGAEREALFHEMRAISATLRSFYQTFTPLPIMPAPDFREFSLLTREMPVLTNYLHRAMSTMHEINEHIRERNSLVAGHAFENANGITAERFIYYSSMLSGLGEYLCQSVDNDLEFFRLTMEQVDRYMKANNEGANYLGFVLVDKAKQALPKENLFPALREQMVTFDKPTQTSSS
ncbi:MAG: hypothetical protein GEU87_02465 [Alphaproteobacteria bacterium]|nr:hypothetical protein [Alphaproteobacteria bacterium]